MWGLGGRIPKGPVQEWANPTLKTCFCVSLSSGVPAGSSQSLSSPVLVLPTPPSTHGHVENQFISENI